MALCLKIRKEKGEFAKRKLSALDIINKKRKITRSKDFLYIPIKSRAQAEKLKLGKIVEHKAPLKKSKPKSFLGLLKGKLTQSELTVLRTSYDVFGEIAILEIPPKLEQKEKIIGNALLDFYPGMRAVFKKAGAVAGTYRVRPLKLLAGKGGTETTYKESGCIFRFDLAKVFFTGRLGTERLRIAKQVKPNEVIVDMFAGVGPFSIVIAKKQPLTRKIYAIDINKQAVKYLKENIKLNKLSEKIVPLQGDAVKFTKKLAGTADRIIMNLPKTEKNYFPAAAKFLKKKGILHFYTFSENEEAVKQQISTLLKEQNYKILKVRKVRRYSPGFFNFSADIQLRKLNKPKKNK